MGLFWEFGLPFMTLDLCLGFLEPAVNNLVCGSESELPVIAHYTLFGCAGLCFVSHSSPNKLLCDKLPCSPTPVNEPAAIRPEICRSTPSLGIRFIRCMQ